MKKIYLYSILLFLFTINNVIYAIWDNTFHFTYESTTDSLNLMFNNWNDLRVEKFEIVLWLNKDVKYNTNNWILPIDTRIASSNTNPWKITDISNYWEWGDWMTYYLITVETEFVVVWDDEFEWVPVQYWDDIEILRITNIWWTDWLRILNIEWWLTKVYDHWWVYYWNFKSDKFAWWQVYYDDVLISFVNNPPVVKWVKNVLWHEWKFFSWTPLAHDQDWDIMIFSWNNIPLWLSFDIASWTISWTASVAWVFTWINLSVQDTYWALTLMEDFDIIINKWQLNYDNTNNDKDIYNANDLAEEDKDVLISAKWQGSMIEAWDQDLADKTQEFSVSIFDNIYLFNKYVVYWVVWIVVLISFWLFFLRRKKTSI